MGICLPRYIVTQKENMYKVADVKDNEYYSFSESEWHDIGMYINYLRCSIEGSENLKDCRHEIIDLTLYYMNWLVSCYNVTIFTSNNRLSIVDCKEIKIYHINGDLKISLGDTEKVEVESTVGSIDTLHISIEPYSVADVMFKSVYYIQNLELSSVVYERISITSDTPIRVDNLIVDSIDNTSGFNKLPFSKDNRIRINKNTLPIWLTDEKEELDLRNFNLSSVERIRIKTSNPRYKNHELCILVDSEEQIKELKGLLIDNPKVKVTFIKKGV